MRQRGELVIQTRPRDSLAPPDFEALEAIRSRARGRVRRCETCRCRLAAGYSHARCGECRVNAGERIDGRPAWRELPSNERQELAFRLRMSVAQGSDWRDVAQSLAIPEVTAEGIVARKFYC